MSLSYPAYMIMIDIEHFECLILQLLWNDWGELFYMTNATALKHKKSNIKIMKLAYKLDRNGSAETAYFRKFTHKIKQSKYISVQWTIHTKKSEIQRNSLSILLGIIHKSHSCEQFRSAWTTAFPNSNALQKLQTNSLLNWKTLFIITAKQHVQKANKKNNFKI